MIKKHGPWRIKKSVQKYKNPWIEVQEDQVIRPDGKAGIFGLVTMKPGVSMLPLDKNGYVYLTSGFHYAVGKIEIEMVSGAIDNREKHLAAAKRELREELGCTAEEWLDLGKVNPFTEVVHSPAYLFLARKLKFGKTNREGTEKTMRLIKVKLEKAFKMVLQSKITHAQSCVLILKAYEYLRKAGRP